MHKYVHTQKVKGSHITLQATNNTLSSSNVTTAQEAVNQNKLSSLCRQHNTCITQWVCNKQQVFRNVGLTKQQKKNIYTYKQQCHIKDKCLYVDITLSRCVTTFLPLEKKRSSSSNQFANYTKHCTHSQCKGKHFQSTTISRFAMLKMPQCKKEQENWD